MATKLNREELISYIRDVKKGKTEDYKHRGYKLTGTNKKLLETYDELHTKPLVDNKTFNMEMANEIYRNEMLNKANKLPPLEINYGTLNGDVIKNLLKKKIDAKPKLKSMLDIKYNAKKNELIKKLNVVSALPEFKTSKTLDEIQKSFNKLYSNGYKKFTPEQVGDLIKKLGGFKISFEIKYENGTVVHRTFNNRKDLLPNILKNGRYMSKLETYGSDAMEEFEKKDITSMRIVYIENGRKSKTEHNQGLGFFRYLNTTDIPLECYQIYTEESQSVLTAEENENCLVYTLRGNQIPEEKIKQLKTLLGGAIHIQRGKFPDVCKIIEKKINFHHYDENSKQIKRVVYGKEFKDEINIAVYENHIFDYEETNYTQFYIQNKQQIDEKFGKSESRYSLNAKLIRKNKNGDESITYYCKKNKVVLLNSLELIRTMKRANLFSSYNVVFKKNDNYVSEDDLNNVRDEQEINNEKLTDPERLPDDVAERLLDEKNIISYEKIHGLKKLIKKTDKKPKSNFYMFADFESDVSSFKTDEGFQHKAIAFGVASCVNDVIRYERAVYENDEQFECQIGEAIHKILKANNVSSEDVNVIMFIHNLKYDSKFLDEMFFISSEVSKDNQIYSKTYHFGHYLNDTNIRVQCRDSLKLLPFKLAELPEMFGLINLSKGEAINYNFHTVKNISTNAYVKVKEYQSKEDKQKLLLDALRKNKELYEFNEKTQTFNSTKYYLEYLKKDCIVLATSLNAFDKLITQITGNSAFKYLTTSSIGYNFAMNSGCFDNISSVKGSLREYIQKSIKGGRVWVNDEFKGDEIEEIVDDFDGVSLYPSAMVRLCREYGLPMGEIHASNSKDFEFYQTKNMYVVKIKITKITKKCNVPLVSYKNDKGIIKYVNEIETDGIIDTVNKITLEDYIKYAGIEFEIIDGIYWENGFNTKLGDLLQKLHNERCKYKSTNTAMSNIIKLIMNSIYGKCGISRSIEQTVYTSLEKGEQYIYDHYGTICEYEKTNKNYRIVKNACDNSFNLNYVSSLILSMSKRIMNEVFNTMQLIDAPVFYTDTDSIHMLRSDVSELGKKFKEIYNRDLIGKELGQFHSDFSFPKEIKKQMKDEHDAEIKNIVSICHIPIAPKIYLDIIQGDVMKDGEKLFEIKDVHRRIKGINNAGIDHEICSIMKKQKLNEIDAHINLFRRIAKGKQIDFNMTPDNNEKVSFIFTKNNVKTRNQGWIRSINKSKKDADDIVSHSEIENFICEF